MARELAVLAGLVTASCDSQSVQWGVHLGVMGLVAFESVFMSLFEGLNGLCLDPPIDRPYSNSYSNLLVDMQAGPTKS